MHTLLLSCATSCRETCSSRELYFMISRGPIQPLHFCDSLKTRRVRVCFGNHLLYNSMQADLQESNEFLGGCF